MNPPKKRLLYRTREVALPLERRAFLRALGAGAAAALVPLDGRAAPRDVWQDADAIAHRIKPPRLPARVFDVTRYGARPTGGADCSAAIRAAIAACHDAGGGQVLVPPG